MKWKAFACSLLLPLLGCAVPWHSSKQQLPSVSEACRVLTEFRGEYSYGGLGWFGESNDGELAVWVIFHSTNAVTQLVELYPQCQPSGKAYVLAALYHADKAAFQKLKNAFCQEPGYIVIGDGCIEETETRADLVMYMQGSHGELAFDPSRPPRRESSMKFRGDHRDAYAEPRARGTSGLPPSRSPLLKTKIQNALEVRLPTSEYPHMDTRRNYLRLNPSLP